MERKSERSSLPRRRVLVADNHEDLAQIVGQLIAMEETLDFVGYVTSGAAALERARSGAAGAADIVVKDGDLESLMRTLRSV